MYLCEARRFLFLLPKCVACLGVGVCVLSLSILFSLHSWAQFSPKPPASAAAQPEVAKDPLGRNTPRGTVLAFLSAARKGDRDLAARYLDTRLRGPAANFLAQQLYVVLDRRLPARLNQLSDLPEGSLSDPLHPDQEQAGTIKGKQGNVDIILERIDRGKSGALWLFSTKTLDSIPDLYDEISVVSVDNVLPEFLINNRFLGIRLFQWLAVFVGVPLFYVLAALLNRLLSPLVGLWFAACVRTRICLILQSCLNQVRLLLHGRDHPLDPSKIIFRLLARQFWTRCASVITIAGLRLAPHFDEQFAAPTTSIGASPSARPSGIVSIFRLAQRAIDGLVSSPVCWSALTTSA